MTRVKISLSADPKVEGAAAPEPLYLDERAARNCKLFANLIDGNTHSKTNVHMVDSDLKANADDVIELPAIPAEYTERPIKRV